MNIPACILPDRRIVSPSRALRFLVRAGWFPPLLVAFAGLAGAQATDLVELALDGSGIEGEFGAAVARIDDIDGDGVADILVGAPGSDAALADGGSVRLFSGADRSIVRTFHGSESGACFGRTVAGVADMDLDAVPDIVVGSPCANGGGGRVTVFSGLSGSVIFTLDGAPGTQLGSAVAGAGDCDGDGRAEIVVGEPGFDPGGTPDAGRVLVISSAGTILFDHAGSAAGERLGSAVDGGLDIDADGWPDIVAGAPGGAGRVIALDPRDDKVLTSLAGAAAGSEFGASVAILGRSPGSQFAKILVGLPGDDRTGPDAGAAQLFDASSGQLLWEALGEEAGGALGAAVATRADVDYDYREDVLLGAPGAGSGAGRFEIWSARTLYRMYSIASPSSASAGSAVAGIGDLDGDGTHEIVVGMPDAAGGGAASVWKRPYEVVLFGAHGSEVCGCGCVFTPFYDVHSTDIDGDGFADFVLAERFGASCSPHRGRVLAYSGVGDSPLILNRAVPSGNIWGVDSTVDLDGDGVREMVWTRGPHPSLDDYFEIVGSQSGAVLHSTPLPLWGVDLDACGDVDGDGVGDFVCGGWTSPTGETHVIVSGDDGAILLQLAEPAGETVAVSRLGDIDGDGHDDLAAAGTVIRVLSGADGSVIWSHGSIPVTQGLALDGGVDVNGDMIPDFAYGFGSTVRVVSGVDGSILVELDEPGEVVASVKFTGDMEGDGWPELLVGYRTWVDGHQNYTVLYTTRNWSRVRTFSDPGHAEGGGLQIAEVPDLDGDGRSEVLIQGSFRHFNNWRGSAYAFRVPENEAYNSGRRDSTITADTSIEAWQGWLDDRAVTVDGAVLEIVGTRSFRSLRLVNGGVLTHPAGVDGGFHLTVEGAVVIDATSSIDVSGKGYPAGEGPGSSSSGAGHGGFGGSRNGGGFGMGYGSPFSPRMLGSGGGGEFPDNHGGGAVALDCGTLVLGGTVRADGFDGRPAGSAGSGGGAGGSVWIVAQELAGTGEISADGGAAKVGFNGHGGGGGGRVHVQTLSDSSTGAIHAFGGTGIPNGGAGTVVRFPSSVPGKSDLIVRNFQPGLDITIAPQNWAPTQLGFDMLTLNQVVLDDGVRVTYPRGSIGIRWSPGALYLGPGAAIDVNGLGYPTYEGPGRPPAGTQSGGGHGGRGGETGGGPGGVAYDSAVLPLLPGSGGGSLFGVRHGGGSVAIRADLVIDGAIYANGERESAGGSILLSSPGLSGLGLISARGGDGDGAICGNLSGAGGGGRIAIIGSHSYTGTIDVSAGWSPPWASGCFGGIDLAEDGTTNLLAGPPPDLPEPPPGIDRLETFDEIPTGSAPDRAPNDGSGLTGYAHSWGYPPGYDLLAVEDGVGIHIVQTGFFEANALGNSLALDPAGVFSPLYVSGHWSEAVPVRTRRIVRVEARVWAANGPGGAGRLAIGHAKGSSQGSTPVADLGPMVEWMADGRIVAHDVGAASTTDLVAFYPRDEWQTVRLDVNLETDTYDFWWAAEGEFLQRIAVELPFVSPQSFLDRFVIGQTEPAEAYFDDLFFDPDWCRPLSEKIAPGTRGTFGIPKLKIDTTADVEIHITNSLGATTTGFLAVSSGELILPPPFGGMGLAGQRDMQPIIIPPEGRTITWASSKVYPCSSETVFLQCLMYDPGAAGGWSKTNVSVLISQP